MASANGIGDAIAQEQRLGGGRGRGLTAVERDQRLPVPVQQERAAADAARLRLDERQHHLHRNRGVDAVPPASSISAPASVASGLAAATIHVDDDQPGLSVQPLAPSGADGSAPHGERCGAHAARPSTPRAAPAPLSIAGAYLAHSQDSAARAERS